MLFKCFTAKADWLDTLNREVQDFISTHEGQGMHVDHKTVHVEGSGDNSLIKPTVVVTVWMEKNAN